MAPNNCIVLTWSRGRTEMVAETIENRLEEKFFKRKKIKFIQRGTICCSNYLQLLSTTLFHFLVIIERKICKLKRIIRIQEFLEGNQLM